MFNQSRDYFALNFFESKIRLLQLDRSGKKILVSGEFPLPPQVITEGYLKNEEKALQSLRQILQKTKIKEKFVVVGLPEDQAFIRTVHLPNLPPPEINQALRWQADSLLPLPFEKVYLDWRLIKKTNHRKHLLLLAVSRQLIDGYINVLTRLSLKPIAFEVRSLSLARLVKDSQFPACLVIELDHEEATLAIVQSPQTLLMSSTFRGELASNEFFQLIFQMKAFYQKEYQSDQELPILITGEKANSQLVSLISQKTNSQAKIYFPKLSNFPPSLALSFASSIALANQPVAAPISEQTINLLPPQIQGIYDQAAQKRKRVTWLRIYSFLFLFCLFILGFLFFKLSQLSRNLTTEIAASQKFPVTTEQRNAQTKAKEINQASAVVLKLASDRPQLAQIFPEIALLVDKDIILSHLSFDQKKNTLVLEGWSASRSRLLQFKEQLEGKKQFFSQVEIPLTSLEKKENFSFSLTVFLKQN